MANDFKVSQTIQLKTQVDEATLRSAVQKVNTMLKGWSGVSGGFKIGASSGNIFGNVTGASSQQIGSINRVFNSMLGLKKAINETADSSNNLKEATRANMGKVLAWAAGWQIAYGAINAVKQLMSDTITVFADFESAMANIKIVNMDSKESYDAFGDSLFQVGKKFGLSAKEAVGGAQLWVQQGRTLKESLKLTEIAAIGVNISGLDMKTMVEDLTTVMRSFNIDADDSITILDKLLQVANMTDIGIGDLASGMQRVGSTADLVGVTMEELAAMIGTIASVTHRGAGEIGNALRTIFMRENQAEMRSFINDVMKIPVYIDKYGKATTTQTNKVRSLTAVMRDSAKAFQETTLANQAAFISRAAGLRQGDKLIALFQNWTMVEKLLAGQLDSSGLAMKANAIIMETFNKKMGVLRATYEEFVAALGETIVLDVLTDIVRNTKKLLEHFTSITKALKSSSGALATFKTLLEGVILLLASAALLAPGGATNFLAWATIGILGTAKAMEFLAMNSRNAGVAYAEFTKKVSGYDYATTRKNINELSERIIKTQADIVARQKNLDSIDPNNKNNIGRGSFIGIDPSSPDYLNRKSIKDIKIEMSANLMMQINADKKQLQILHAHRRALIDELKERKSISKEVQDTVNWEEQKKLIQEKNRHILEISRISGESALQIKKQEYEIALNLEDTTERELRIEKARNALAEEYASTLNSMAKVYQDIVANGIYKMVEGTGTLLDMTKEMIGAFQKSMITDMVDMVGQSTGIFSLMSTLTKNPIAQAHLKGMEGGAKYIVSAHIAGIKAGLSGQSTASALASMEGGGGVVGGFSALTTNMVNGRQMGPLGQIGNYFGANNPVKTNIGSYQGYRTSGGKPYNNMGGMQNLGASALYGASAAMTSIQSGVNPGYAVVGGTLQAIGMMAMMTPSPDFATQLGGAILFAVGMLTSMMGGGEKTTTETREQTKQITSRINVTNKQLEIVNRNLIALKRGFEGWAMMESYYLRSRSRLGVNIQNEFALNMRRGAQ